MRNCETLWPQLHTKLNASILRTQLMQRPVSVPPHYTFQLKVLKANHCVCALKWTLNHMHLSQQLLIRSSKRFLTESMFESRYEALLGSREGSLRSWDQTLAGALASQDQRESGPWIATGSRNAHLPSSKKLHCWRRLGNRLRDVEIWDVYYISGSF